VITGCVGGIIRDVVAGRPSIIMSPELYVTPAALASALCVAGMTAAPWLGTADEVAWGLAFACGFALRAVAIRWEWGLPGYGGPSSAG
ncbi:MAG: trimeric intracellular cation channel family protein, partial [Sphingomonas sp.]